MPNGSIDSQHPGCEGKLLFRRLLVIALFVEMGLLLAALPWTAFWEHNYFAQTVPFLRSILMNDFVRGAVTGLGLINLYVGLVDVAYLVGGASRTSGRGKAPERLNEEPRT